MPVDLSRVGLEGIEVGQQTLSAIEARNSERIAQEAKLFELEQGRKKIELSNLAAQRLQQIGSGNYKSPGTLFNTDDADVSEATPLNVLAETFMLGGAPEEGAAFAKAAMGIRKQESEIERAEYLNQKTILENTLSTADIVSRTVGIARNQYEWEEGIEALERANVLEPGHIGQLRGLEYDPDVVAYVNEAATSAAQRAQLDMTSKTQDRMERDLTFRQGNARRLQSIAEQRLEIARQAELRQAKVGKSSSTPNEQEVKAARAAVISQVFRGAAPGKVKAGQLPSMEESALESGTQAIAERAKQLTLENPSLTYNTALNRAISESELNGDWEILQGTAEEPGGLFGWGGKEATPRSVERFTGGGRTSEEALPLPTIEEAGKPIIDPKSLKKGRWYITVKGPAQWTGKNWKVIRP